MKLVKTLAITLTLFFSFMVGTHAYMINGKYARLISCDYAYSAVRGESGYTGTYEVMGEIWTVYFGASYCKY